MILSIIELAVFLGLAAVGAGFVLLKIHDILKRKRDEEYYLTLKDDTAFWQKKIEQTANHIGRYFMDETPKRIGEMMLEIQKAAEEAEKGAE